MITEYLCLNCNEKFNGSNLCIELHEMMKTGEIKPGDNVLCPSCKAKIENPREVFSSRWDVQPVTKVDSSSSFYKKNNISPLRALILCPMCRGVFVDAPSLPDIAECTGCNTKFCLERGEVLICPALQNRPPSRCGIFTIWGFTLFVQYCYLSSVYK